MRYLVVNGDDLGLAPGVNRGIVEAHERGVLTSASLIVNSPWTEDALARIGPLPGLSVGLHVNLLREGDGRVPNVAEQLHAQAERFHTLVGREPAHIDSHHNDHAAPELLPHFSALAADAGVPLRGHSSIRSLTSFYGQWGGVTHPEQISVDGLITILRRGCGDGVTELACHPGYVDSALRSSYAGEREIELTTLCDPRVPQALGTLGVELIGFRDAVGLLDDPEGREAVRRVSAQP